MDYELLVFKAYNFISKVFLSQDSDRNGKVHRSKAH